MICINLKSLITGKHKYQLLREKVTCYDVTMTGALYGDFAIGLDVRVLAFNPKHAVRRARKRGCKTGIMYFGSYSGSQFGKYRVKESSKPDNHRFYHYFS